MNTMQTEIRCPVCGKSDQVEKVSTLYLTGLGKNSRARDPRPQSSRAFPASGRFPSHRNFAPPASGKQVTIRIIHPDQAVLAFSLVVPFFLYGILTSQPGSVLIAIGVLVLFYVFYLWQRKKLIARFQSQIAEQKASVDRIQLGIARWMKLYYCACDDWVFEPGTDTLAPLDQMMGILLREP